MQHSIFSGTPAERLRFITLLVFLFLCLVGGGGSRADISSLLYVRPAAIICILVFLLTAGVVDFRSYRALFVLFAAFAATMLVQLVPLPPGLWLSLAGRERYAEAVALSGADAWHPISLTPDLTTNSLLALLVPLAVLIGYAGIRPDQRQALLPWLVAGACASAVLGIIQLSSGTQSPAYLYDITHSGSAVGFFSNRNHQGALLAMTFPMLRIWTLMPTKDEKYRRTRMGIAAGIGLILVPVLLVTGSRAGMALGLVGLAAAALIAPLRSAGAGKRGWRTAVNAALLIGPLTLAVLVTFFGRAIAIDRLIGQDLQEEFRLQHTPLMIEMIGKFFPFGSGFGSFDPVFRNFEPDWALNPRYFNHAHNDLIELVLTGGAPAVLVLVLFLLWFGRNAWAAFLRRRGQPLVNLLARLGTVMILVLFLASLVDYPLRTPLMSVIFVIACGWLADVRARGSSQSQGEVDGGQRLAL